MKSAKRQLLFDESDLIHKYRKRHGKQSIVSPKWKQNQLWDLWNQRLCIEVIHPPLLGNQQIPPLGKDVIACIFRFLPRETLYSCRLVNRMWCKEASNPDFWSGMSVQNYSNAIFRGIESNEEKLCAIFLNNRELFYKIFGEPIDDSPITARYNRRSTVWINDKKRFGWIGTSWENILERYIVKILSK